MTDQPQNDQPRKPSLARMLAKVSRLVGGRMRTLLVGIGLHHAQGLILSRLWHEDGQAQSALAQALHITSPTATNTLQRMERDGWIERRRDDRDQRVVRAYLTPRARALRKKAQATFRELDRELAAVLTEEERENLMAILQKIRRHLMRTGQPGCGCPSGLCNRAGEERDRP